MLAQRDPNEVYRRIEFDARVCGADPRELVRVCYEQLIGSLGGALIAATRRDNQMKSQTLTRALSALTALQMGVSGDNAVAQALLREVNALYTCGPAGGGGVRTALRARLNAMSCLAPRVAVTPRYSLMA